MIQLNYRDSKPIYEQIKSGFKKLILTGNFSANEKLPSVREMAASLAINPNTIQRAYRELEAEGYIYSVPGKGSFVAEQKELLDVRQTELLESFDKTTRELLSLSFDKENLVRRIEKLDGEMKSL